MSLALSHALKCYRTLQPENAARHIHMANSTRIDNGYHFYGLWIFDRGFFFSLVAPFAVIPFRHCIVAQCLLNQRIKCANTTPLNGEKFDSN